MVRSSNELWHFTYLFPNSLPKQLLPTALNTWHLNIWTRVTDWKQKKLYTVYVILTARKSLHSSVNFDLSSTVKEFITKYRVARGCDGCNPIEGCWLILIIFIFYICQKEPARMLKLLISTIPIDTLTLRFFTTYLSTDFLITSKF